MTSAPVVRVCVTGAAGLIAYSLIPQIAMGKVFGEYQPVAINMLDIEPCKQGLDGLAMELEDMVNPLLKDVVASTDPMVAFKDCDYCIMCGAFPRKQGMERRDLLAKNAAIFKEQGLAIAKVAKKDVRVLVVGNPANTNALLVQKYGNLPPQNVTAMTRLDHNRARNMLARKVGGIQGCDVKNLIIWGNHSPTMYPDVRHATINWKPVREVVNDEQWINETFVTEVGQRGGLVIKVRGASSATSAARGAIDHVRDWHLGNPHEWVSMGVMSDGKHYGIPEGIVYSVPCKCLGAGKFEVVEGLEIDDFSRKLMDNTAKELLEEREQALGN